MGGVNEIRERVAESILRPQAGLPLRDVFGACRPGRSPFFLFKVRNAHEFFYGDLGTIRLIVAMRGTTARQGQHQCQQNRRSVAQIFTGSCT